MSGLIAENTTADNTVVAVFSKAVDARRSFSAVLNSTGFFSRIASPLSNMSLCLAISFSRLLVLIASLAFPSVTSLILSVLVSTLSLASLIFFLLFAFYVGFFCGTHRLLDGYRGAQTSGF